MNARKNGDSSVLVVQKIHQPDMRAIVVAVIVIELVTGTHGWVLSVFRRPKHDVEARNIDDLSLIKYDIVIIGAGASGLFASGTASTLGKKTLLLDVGDSSEGSIVNNIGGDCTNSACVPSKAVRSMARKASASSTVSVGNTLEDSKSWLSRAQMHAKNTVNIVRARESPEAMVQRHPNLHVALLSGGKFINPKEMELNITLFYAQNKTTHPFFSNTNQVKIRAKKFIIATGSSPVVPKKLKTEASAARLPLYTYRTIFHPQMQGEDSIWKHLEETTVKKKIVIAGGGATACELAQSLARLCSDRKNIDIHLVAPNLLRTDDVTLQDAALQLLLHAGIHLHLEKRVVGVFPNKSIQLSDGSNISTVDAMILCLGRKPDLESLWLKNAGVVCHKDYGVMVHSSLRSISAKHVFASGDCASAVNRFPNSRTATHAAWTGYHAAINALLPRALTVGSKSVQSTVPRVIYTDPELVTVGLSLAECVKRHGLGGFDRLLAREQGTDRADMESVERSTAQMGFVEIRAAKVDGRVLGMTACGPAASELANEMAVVIENRLAVRHVAKSLHSYPSYGYLMHRVALAMALSDKWGFVESCGPVGRRLVSDPVRALLKFFRLLRPRVRSKQRDSFLSSLAGAGLVVPREAASKSQTRFQMVSILDTWIDEVLRNALLSDSTTPAMTTIDQDFEPSHTIDVLANKNKKRVRKWSTRRMDFVRRHPYLKRILGS